jgi:hypothetical protein
VEERIMAQVKCIVCEQMFDRDGPECIKVRRNRYAHRKCAEEKGLKEFDEATAPPPKKAIIKCKYCGEPVDKKSDDCIKVTNRYAHKHCYDQAPPEEHAEEDFYNYCSHLFGRSYDHVRTRRMAEKFLKENTNWTFQGMLKSLQWFYDIKKHSTDGANGSIGILPFIYEQAKQYYYEVYVAEQSAKIIEETPESREVDIEIPHYEKNKKRIKLLDFEEDLE